MEPLLEPISADAPCGIDLSSEAVYNDLAVMMEGTPENQFVPGSGKDPDWRAVQKLAEGCLARSKDLQISIYFTVALLQTAGMGGATRGLELIAGIVRKYWDTLFPLLDPDDKDPTQRVNIVSQLTVEKGSFGDPVKFIERITATPIFHVPGLAVSIQYLTGEGAAARLPEIMASGDAEEIKVGCDSLRSAVAAVHALDDFLISTVGRSASPSFDPLIKALDKGLRIIDSLTGAAGAGEEDSLPLESGTTGRVATRPSGPGISGEIQSIEDVRRMLAKIRDYYAVAEPASPVPLLLKRAERLVGKNFLELLANLTPNSRSEFDVLLGPDADAGA